MRNPDSNIVYVRALVSDIPIIVREEVTVRYGPSPLKLEQFFRNLETEPWDNEVSDAITNLDARQQRSGKYTSTSALEYAPDTASRINHVDVQGKLSSHTMTR